MDETSMIAELKAYLNHVSFADDLLTAYKSLLKEVEKHNDQINLAPGFFKLTQYALSKTLCIEVAKLYVGSGQERRIQKLINQARGNANIFPKEIEFPSKCGKMEKIKLLDFLNLSEQRLKELEDNRELLRIHRDKHLAHNDPEYFDGTVNPSVEFPLSMEMLQEMITFCGMFCNVLLSSLGQPFVCWKSKNAGDLGNLLSHVSMD